MNVRRPTMFNFETLKAKPYNGEEVLYLHEKHDGHRLTVIAQPVNHPKPMKAMTREQTDLWPQLTQIASNQNIWFWLSNLTRLKPMSAIDGELYVPGKPASYIKTAIKNADPELRFIAFAVPWWDGKRQYIRTLEWAMDRCSEKRIQFANFIKLDAMSSVSPEWALSLAPADIEGYVAKCANYHKWYKIKRVHTLDAIVTGISPGKGKYIGMCGALICSVYDSFNQLVEVCTCSGMTDGQRAAISDADIGRVCEIKYQEVASVGRLRHPNFVRWREDKKPSECTVAQDVNLLRYWSSDVDSVQESR